MAKQSNGKPLVDVLVDDGPATIPIRPGIAQTPIEPFTVVRPDLMTDLSPKTQQYLDRLKHILLKRFRDLKHERYDGVLRLEVKMSAGVPMGDIRWLLDCTERMG